MHKVFNALRLILRISYILALVLYLFHVSNNCSLEIIGTPCSFKIGFNFCACDLHSIEQYNCSLYVGLNSLPQILQYCLGIGVLLNNPNSVFVKGKLYFLHHLLIALSVTPNSFAISVKGRVLIAFSNHSLVG